MTIDILYGGSAVCILNSDGHAVKFLTGEEAEELIEDVQAISDRNYPTEGFKTAEEAVNFFLTDYAD